MSTPKRRYEQRERAEAAAETRRRIVETTRALLSTELLRSVGLPEIAEAAGVARSTIYAVFGSREGLMLAVAEDALRRGGFDQLGAAFRDPDAVAALERSLRVASRLYADEHAVGRALLSLAAVDRDAGVGAARLNRGRREGMQALATRLAAQGALRPDVTIPEAADILWVITSFETWDQLYTGRGLTPDECGDRLVAMARRSVLRG